MAFKSPISDDAALMKNGSMADYLTTWPMAGDMRKIVVAHVETPTRSSVPGAEGAAEACGRDTPVPLSLLSAMHCDP